MIFSTFKFYGPFITRLFFDASFFTMINNIIFFSKDDFRRVTQEVLEGRSAIFLQNMNGSV